MVLRPLLSALVAAALLWAAPAEAAMTPGAARAFLSSCRRGPDPADRAGVFTGSMRRSARNARMQMRFTLQARTPDRARWSTVTAAGFGTWVSSAPGVGRYVYTKRVEGLLAPASYRVAVRFRWLDASGAGLQRTKAYCPVCRQPGPRGDP